MGDVMVKETKFVVKKDEKAEIITYMEYEKIKGLNLKPKHKMKFEDMINVDEMIIINPSLIKKLIDKKCKRNLERILKIISIIYEDDDSDDSSFDVALTEIERLRGLINNKYKSYMDEKVYVLYMKKLELIKQELEERRSYILDKQLEYEMSKKSKSSR